MSCFGYNDGSALVMLWGHSSNNNPYTYQWYGPNNFTSDSMIHNLYQGTYSVTIKRHQ